MKHNIYFDKTRILTGNSIVTSVPSNSTTVHTITCLFFLGSGC